MDGWNSCYMTIMRLNRCSVRQNNVIILYISRAFCSRLSIMKYYLVAIFKKLTITHSITWLLYPNTELYRLQLQDCDKRQNLINTNNQTRQLYCQINKNQALIHTLIHVYTSSGDTGRRAALVFPPAEMEPVFRVPQVVRIEQHQHQRLAPAQMICRQTCNDAERRRGTGISPTTGNAVLSMAAPRCVQQPPSETSVSTEHGHTSMPHDATTCLLATE